MVPMLGREVEESEESFPVLYHAGDSLLVFGTVFVSVGEGDEGMHKIATRFRVGTGTVQRIKAEMAE
jgi:hypothetical protein